MIVLLTHIFLFLSSTLKAGVGCPVAVPKEVVCLFNHHQMWHNGRVALRWVFASWIINRATL